MFFRTAVAVLAMSTVELCQGTGHPTNSYGPSPPYNNDNYSQYNNDNNYESEISRPLAVFTERPVNVANYVLIPVVQIPTSDLKMIYRPQIDSVSKTEPIVICKSSSTKSFVSIICLFDIYLYSFQSLTFLVELILRFDVSIIYVYFNAELKA